MRRERPPAQRRRAAPARAPASTAPSPRSSEPVRRRWCVVDLDAFDANAADLVRRAAGKPIRVASKSLRVPALIQRALAAPGFAGVLAYTLREALWLVRAGRQRRHRDRLPDRRPRPRSADLLGDEPRAAAVTLMVDDVRAPRPGRLGPRRPRRAGAGRDRRRRRAAAGPASTSAPSARPLYDAADVVELAQRDRPARPASRWSA